MAVASRARRSANILGSESGSISTAPSAVPAGSRDDSEYDDTFAAEPACTTRGTTSGALPRLKGFDVVSLGGFDVINPPQAHAPPI
eukprot:6178786-Pleurochrysis_carterae.AAC.1